MEILQATCLKGKNMNKKGSIKISKDIMECISNLAQKENMDPRIYIEMILMKNILAKHIQERQKNDK